ncbi:F0F1 ATP synthase subunit epsilon [Glaciecola nitratireducens FR1064]|uniref:F0F1 ATP synthase subunit epsilon n=1 Tax=Glaciecola nitratireducens (strain JCM 12485 / KCTC 12276 / FR1064) TaxID=1085623 RepID=G4QN41_GLANF|nr:F0F1 ATP synthase subunit epsilon [Glaciecola nitratireducens FR1064]
MAPLPPGILAFTTEKKDEVFVALDEGVLVKTGADVLVSVRNAMMDADLEKLRDVVEKEFLAMDEQALQVRRVMAKLESSFLHRFAKINKP